MPGDELLQEGQVLDGRLLLDCLTLTDEEAEEAVKAVQACR